MSPGPRAPQPLAALMARRNVLLPAVAVLVLIAVWSWRLEPRSFDWVSTNGAGHWPQAGVAARPAANSVDLSDPDAPFVGWPLQRVCDEATPVEGLVFICDNNSGGIGNVRNYIQTCLRYALEAGATGLVVPRIRQRSDKDLSDLFTDYLPFSYMFDEDHFKRAFRTFCPHITVYDDVGAIPHAVQPQTGKPQIQEIKPKDFGDRKGCDWKDMNRHTDRFGRTFRAWLQNEKNGKPPSAATPRLIRFKWGVLWDWPVYRDGPEFAATFGHVLKFNAQLLRLGKAARAAMDAFARAQGQADGAFLGAHLRTENDALGFWPQYETQAKAYLDRAKSHGYRAAYLATGNATEAARFARRAAAELGLRVVGKQDLLRSDELDELNALTWDQQALVDCVVLLASDFFVGPMPSSFSTYVTLKRHLKRDGLYYRPYKSGTEGDGLSYLAGRYEQYWEDWLFMFDGMWP